MKKQSWFVTCATMGPVGFTLAPGTIATIIMLPVVYWLRINLNDIYYGIAVLLFALFSFFCVEKALEFFYKDTDPSEIVLDECLGTLITFWAIPMHWYWLVAGFALFRFFDITKLFGIRKTELLAGSMGVMLDDIIAGILSNIIMHLLIAYLPVLLA